MDRRGEADDRLSSALPLESIEGAPRDERDLHRSEVPGVDARVSLERRQLRCSARVAFDEERIVIGAGRIQREVGRDPDSGDAGNFRRPLDELLIEARY